MQRGAFDVALDPRASSRAQRTPAQDGIFWGAGTTGGRVAANRISGNAGSGFVIEEGDGATVEHNVLARNGDDVVVFGNSNLVRGNAVIDAAGCPDGCGFGVWSRAGPATW